MLTTHPVLNIPVPPATAAINTPGPAVNVKLRSESLRKDGWNVTTSGRGNKVYTWEQQLAYGLQAQQDFHDIYHRPLTAATTFAYDFKVVRTGEKLELKTDDWDHESTPNFFFERWSNWEKQTPGGPWQSRAKRVDCLVYYFARNGIYYEFRDIKKLCKVLDRIIRQEKLGLVLIKNRGYRTGGYKIPRHLVEDLYEVYEVPGI